MASERNEKMEKEQILTEAQEKEIKKQVEEFSNMCIKTCNQLLKDEHSFRTACILVLLEVGLHATNELIRKIINKNLEEKGE